MMRASAMMVLAACAAPGLAQKPPEMLALDAQRDKVSKPALVQSYGARAQAKGELRLPKGKGPHPVAIVIHGGCWSADFDDSSGLAPLAGELTERGIATWNIGYARVGDAGGGWPGTFEDVAAGIDHLPKLAAEHGLDMTRVTLVGHSAGAHLALWGASRAKLGAPWATGRVKPVSVVAIDGPPALAEFVGADTQVCGRPVIAPLMGGLPAEQPERYRLASPAAQLPLGVRQLWVMGTLKPYLGPYLGAARASGDTVEVLEPAGANHFDIITPGAKNGEAVADWIAARAFAER